MTKEEALEIAAPAFKKFLKEGKEEEPLHPLVLLLLWLIFGIPYLLRQIYIRYRGREEVRRFAKKHNYKKLRSQYIKKIRPWRWVYDLTKETEDSWIFIFGSRYFILGGGHWYSSKGEYKVTVNKQSKTVDFMLNPGLYEDIFN